MAGTVRGAVVGFLVLGAAGCAHTPDGERIRTGPIRFDATTVTGPKGGYTREADGTWAGIGGDRYVVEDGALRAVAPFVTSGPIAHGSTRIRIARAPDGVSFIPTAGPAGQWTFITEDGGALPRELEVPLYITARLGLGGLWVTFQDPDYVESAWHLGSDCAVVIFDLQGRRVAGWVQRPGGARCPVMHYPDAKLVASLEKGRNEHWESPLRPGG